MTQKPFAESCEQNKHVILEAIQPLLADKRLVLEIGSGTGQHAVFFARRLPHLVWQCSDRAENLPGIQLWLNEAALDNAPEPLQLDVSHDPWPEFDQDNTPDAIFAANVVHIMAWQNVVDFMNMATAQLPQDGLLMFYGPFNYDGQYTSESNARFDIWLKQQNPQSAIRHFEELDKLARQGGCALQCDIEMPANNRILCWKKD